MIAQALSALTGMMAVEDFRRTIVLGTTFDDDNTDTTEPLQSFVEF